MYADTLRELFPDLAPVVDDLFLLEAHQIAGLPKRAPGDQLSVVLRSRPDLVRFFATRCPPIQSFLDELMASPAAIEYADAVDGLVWELADLIVYQRAPQLYDSVVECRWNRDALVEIEPLHDKVVVDAGAGTGKVTFAMAPWVATVFAVEPVATLRGFIRDKAKQHGLSNVYVLDGVLASIPLPNGAANALVTQRAIGWDLDAELVEIERVVAPGGSALHLLGVPHHEAEASPLHAALLGHGYEPGSYQDGPSMFAKYAKHCEG